MSGTPVFPSQWHKTHATSAGCKREASFLPAELRDNKPGTRQGGGVLMTSGEGCLSDRPGVRTGGRGRGDEARYLLAQTPSVDESVHRMNRGGSCPRVFGVVAGAASSLQTINR